MAEAFLKALHFGFDLQALDFGAAMTSSLGLDFAAMSDLASQAVAPMNMIFNAFWFLRFALNYEWRIFAGKFTGKA